MGEADATIAGEPAGPTPVTARLLWAVARPQPDVAEVRSAIHAGADVELVAAHAFVNRVGPLCWAALGLADAQNLLSDNAAEVMQREADVWRAQALMGVPRALELSLTPLADAGLETVVFKGPVLSKRYPAPGLRPMDDIDIMLPSRDHDRALEILRGAGWEVRAERRRYDSYLVHQEVPALPLELHYDLNIWRDRLHGMRGIDLWRARVPTTLEGCRAYTVPVEEELIALATHAGKPFHTFNRLIWSVDIALVVQQSSIDWDRLVDLARHWGCQVMLAVALRHAIRLGATVPDEVVELPSGRTRRAALAPVLDERWPLDVYDVSAVHRLRYALLDSPLRNARLFIYDAASPQLGEGPLWRAPKRSLHLARMAFKRWREMRRAEAPPDDPDDHDH